MYMDLLTFDTFGWQGKHILVPIPQASTRVVFIKKGSRDVICQIPRLLVNNSKLELIENENEKKENIQMENI